MPWFQLIHIHAVYVCAVDVLVVGVCVNDLCSVSKDLLSENFQDHPSFAIPSRNLYLNLTGDPPESDSYYSFISYMKTLLLSYDGESNSEVFSVTVHNHSVL